MFPLINFILPVIKFVTSVLEGYSTFDYYDAFILMPQNKMFHFLYKKMTLIFLLQTNNDKHK